MRATEGIRALSVERRLADKTDNHDAWRTALQEDPEIGVAILGPDGHVKSASPTAAHILSAFSAERCKGMPLARLVGDGACDECMALIERVAAKRLPLIIEGVWRGVRARCVVRPLPPGNGGAVILLVRHAYVRLRREEAGLELIVLGYADWGTLGPLSHRERQILGLIGVGMTAAQISRKLGRSVKTVDAHRRSIGKKLRVRNRVELARLAIQCGLSPLVVSNGKSRRG
jgi:DNA-binding CsgD family transcriptional regulator